MPRADAPPADVPGTPWRRDLAPPAPARLLGRSFVRFGTHLGGLVAFMLITLGSFVTKFHQARRVVGPLTLAQVARSGVSLLPMTLFLAAAVGLLVIGQTVSLLSAVGANTYAGTVMVAVVVRELGPLLTALLLLSRIGAATVIELGTARALGEVEALEAMRIDPIHYLVVPRVAGMTLGSVGLTIYLVLGALVSGYAWAFLQKVPLAPAEYFRQLASALRALDFIILGAKSAAFGFVISMVTCFHGLAQPLRLDEISRACIRAVAQSLILCIIIDAVFVLLYLLA